MKRVLILSSIVTLISAGIYSYLVEPEMINAAADADDIDVTLSVTAGITLTPPSNIAMSPAITMTQNTSIGTGSAWNVKTNNQAGYKLELKSDEDNALKDASTSEYFTDYTEATAGTPDTWSVTTAYEFGFSVFGTDAPTATWGTDTDCIAGAGIPSAALKWRGFDGTTQIQVATKATETPTAGVNTTLCVGAEQNGVYAPSGSYTADVTGTATTL